MWPFRKRGEQAPDGPAATAAEQPITAYANGWRQLPPVQRVIPDAPTTVSSAGFQSQLVAWRPTGVTRRPLSHQVSYNAPTGSIGGVVTVSRAAVGHIAPSVDLPLTSGAR